MNNGPSSHSVGDSIPPQDQLDVFEGAGRLNLPLVKLVKVATGILSRIYIRVHAQGLEHVPDEGAYLMITNHVSGLDPFVIGTMVSRPMYCLAKVELYRNRTLTWFLNSLGYIPLDRSTEDISAMRIVLRLLRNGEAVGLSPEGTRSQTGEIQPFQPGVTKLVLRTQVPILPVAIYGTRELMPPGAHMFKSGEVYLNIGELFDLSHAYDRPITPELLEENTRVMYQKVSELYEAIRYRPLN
jgi:1-acyl-sn-glycerol-3-phosphate acyltransferase